MKGKGFLRSIAYGIGCLLLVAGAVYAIRRYVGESYRISTEAMAESLCEGDYIIVNKLPQSPSKRRNQIVLFHSPLQKDSLSRPLFISRIWGIPGDTLLVNPDGYLINGKKVPNSPQALARYFCSSDVQDTVFQQLKRLDIPLRELRKEAFGCTISLTAFEEYRLRSELSATCNSRFIGEQKATYQLIVPKKGQAYRIDAASLVACRAIIERETAGEARIKEDKLFVDGRETTFFYFKHDYYWVLSDNSEEGIDSRHLGFIAADQLIGNAWFCWYSTDQQRRFKWIQ